MANKTKQNKEVLRMRRIIGQCKAIEKMLRKGRDCDTILQEIMAARNSLGSLGAEYIKNQCNSSAARGDSERVQKLVRKFLKFK